MAYNTFKEQFPGYTTIPEKKSRWAEPLTWLAAIVFGIGAPGFVLYKLAGFQVPSPAISGVNSMTVSTYGGLGMAQANRGEYSQAASNFSKYFELGGQDADMMAMYAYSLSQLGHRAEALEWSRKAIAKSPQSKAARLIHDTLEPRK
jgi:hypothetical protein